MDSKCIAHMNWINVENELPQEDEIVLTYNSSKIPALCIFYNKKFRLLSNLGFSCDDITHWTSFPSSGIKNLLPEIFAQLEKTKE